MGACCSQSDDLGSLSDILSDLDNGVGNEQVAFRVSQRVRCKDKGDAQWRTGTVTSAAPLEVHVDGWDSAHSWDQVEAEHELAPTLVLSCAPVLSDVQPPVVHRDSAMPDSLGFAMQSALPRGREREVQQTQATQQARRL